MLGKYFIQERTNASLDELPPHLINALIVTEDTRFYKHNGIDYRSFIRVLLKTIIMQNESAGGGSTISQQLAKNIYGRKRFGILTIPVTKIKEAIIATRLEKIYSKKEILTLYFNTVSFGENAFGIVTASERFFNKSPMQLSIAEAAVLIGMLKATHTYNPKKFPKQSKKRRNVILQQMAKYEFLERSIADSLKNTTLVINYKQLSHNDGLATYFRAQIRKELQNWCKTHYNNSGKPYNLYTDGLKIYTTINAKLQIYAEEAVAKHMAQLQNSFSEHWHSTKPWDKNSDILANAVKHSKRYKLLKKSGQTDNEIKEIFKTPISMKIFTWDGEKEVIISPLDSVKHYVLMLNAGLLSIEPSTGYVRAWVGGINHKYFKYDHVNHNTKRQVGSIFKPIVYAAALKRGVKPCEYISTERRIYRAFENWSPTNASGNYKGKYSMEGALTNSINTVSVKVLKKAGIKNTIAMGKSMGIINYIPEVPSIALGTANLSLYEMVSTYCTFANYGKRITPQYLASIVDKNGKTLAIFDGVKKKNSALSKENAALMLHMMTNVVNQGTAARLRSKFGLHNAIAGKTGTTQSHADGWFIGITPKLVTGVWVGADDPRIHFRSIKLGQGAHMALPIFALYTRAINSDKSFTKISKANFKKVPGYILSKLDCKPYIEKENILHDFFKHWAEQRDQRKSKEKYSDIFNRPGKQYTAPKKRKKIKKRRRIRRKRR